MFRQKDNGWEEGCDYTKVVLERMIWTRTSDTYRGNKTSRIQRQATEVIWETEKMPYCGGHDIIRLGGEKYNWKAIWLQKIIARTNGKKLASPWACQLQVSMAEMYQKAAAREAAVTGWRFGGNEPDTVVGNNYSLATR